MNLRKHLPAHGIDLAGADERSTNEITQAWSEMTAAFPRVPDTLRVGKPPAPDAEGAYAWTDSDIEQITVNKEYARDYDHWVSTVREGESTGMIHKGVSAAPGRYAVLHEFGHALANTVLGRIDRLDNSGEDNWQRFLMGVGMPPTATAWLWQMFLRAGRQQDIIDQLSEYATASPHEFVAEAFGVHRFFGPGTSAIADQVHDALVAEYQRKYGEAAA